MRFKGIVIHHSESNFGTALDIDSWHKARGFDSIGYHAVISNGQIDKNRFVEFMDGSIEAGREWKLKGAHAIGYNDYFGICLIGEYDFTDAQFDSLLKVCRWIMKEYDIPAENVIGHREIEGVTKDCPGFEVEEIRRLLSADEDVWNG